MKKVKVINNILPTGDNLAFRFPNIYNSWKCALCEEYNETLDYLLICSALTTEWAKVKQGLSEYLDKFKVLYDLQLHNKSVINLIIEDKLDNDIIHTFTKKEWLTGLLT